MPSDVSDLCQRILQRCRERQWYGADAEHLWHTSPTVWRETWYDPSGTPVEIIRELPIERFAHARATAEQVAQTERVLGCRLPTVLTTVYLHVANGGFGPGYGLATVQSLTKVTRGSWRLGARTAHYLEVHPRRYLECDEAPDTRPATESAVQPMLRIGLRSKRRVHTVRRWSARHCPT